MITKEDLKQEIERLDSGYLEKKGRRIYPNEAQAIKLINSPTDPHLKYNGSSQYLRQF